MSGVYSNANSCSDNVNMICSLFIRINIIRTHLKLNFIFCTNTKEYKERCVLAYLKSSLLKLLWTKSIKQANLLETTTQKSYFNNVATLLYWNSSYTWWSPVDLPNHYIIIAGGVGPPYFFSHLLFCSGFEEVRTVLFENELTINNSLLTLTL